MKKNVLLILFVCFNSSIFAQVSAGLIGGINFSNIDSKNSFAPSFDMVSAPGIGAVVDVMLTSNLGLRFEPMYFEKGADLNLIDAPFLPDFSLNMYNIELPLLLKFSIDGDVSPYFLFGPMLDINVDSEIETRILGFGFNVNTGNITRDVNLGLLFGGGFSYSTGSITLFIEGRYSLGLTDITEHGSVNIELGDYYIEEQFSIDPELRSKGVQVMVGFLLPLGN